MLRTHRLSILIALLILTATGCGHGGIGRTYSSLPDGGEIPVSGAWTELGPNGAVIARTVSSGPGCPTLETNLGPAPMDVRVPAMVNFPETCEKRLPEGIKTVTLSGHPLALPPHRIDRIVVIGDTGCRLKIQDGTPPQIQDCVSEWPFAKIAAAAAKLHPDIVIHVGDYHYRESVCPEGNPGCAGSITGDVWGSWYQDFFHPGADLLAAAPWVFVRGNHEACSRAGRGYFRLLDPRPMPIAAGDCQESTDPYVVHAGAGVPPIVVVDSSFADFSAALLAPFTALEPSLKKAGGAWMVTHRPPWTPVGAPSNSPMETSVHSAIVDEDKEPAGEEAGESTVVPATGPVVGVAPGVELTLTGHRHTFEAMTFKDGRSPLIIGGDGGTALDADVPTDDLTGHAVDTTTLSSWSAIPRFGFLEFEAHDTLIHRHQWQMTVHDASGAVMKSCTLLPPRHHREKVMGLRLKCKS